MVKPKLLDQIREAVRSGISAIGQTRHYYPDQGSAQGRMVWQKVKKLGIWSNMRKINY